YGPTSGANIAAPGSNSSTSVLNGANVISNTFIDFSSPFVPPPTGDHATLGAAAPQVDPPIADAIIASIAGLKKDGSPDLSGGLSQYGTGRVRRFSSETSGFTAPRSDTGVIALPGN